MVTKITIATETIKLDQFLKWASLVGTGGQAKFFITRGDVQVNGQVETKRGRVLYPGDLVTFQNNNYEIMRETEQKY